MKTLQCNDIFISRPVWFLKIPEDLLEKAQLCDLVESHIQPFLVPLRRVRNHTNTAPAAPVHLCLLHMLIQAPPAPICSGEWLGCCVGHGGAGRSVNMCCSGPLRLPACLGQLGSRVCVLDPPPPPPLETLIDWSLIFLTGWHPATKLWSGRDPWEGIERARTWRRERRKRRKMKRKNAAVCQMIMIRLE